MRNALKAAVTGLMVLAWSICFPGAGNAAPPVKVSLALANHALDASGGVVYLLDAQAITAVLTLENTGASFIAQADLEKKPFHLFLTFIGPDGKGITAVELAGNQGDPDPSLVVRSGDALVQVQAVKAVPAGWVFTVTMPDTNAYYTLGKAGRYSVKATIRMRTYPAVNFTLPAADGISTVDYAMLDSADWQGTLESNTVEFAIIDDHDGDGYYYPQGYGSAVLPDCDDNNPAVHPGASEIVGNGLDDDCDPATADAAPVPRGTVFVRAERHTVGTGSHPGSTKDPITDMPVMLYDKSPYSCVSGLGVSWQNYPAIWSICPPIEAVCDQPDCLTGGDGTLSLVVPEGDYVVIGRYDPDPLVSGDYLYIGVSIGTVAANETVQKYLQVIKKADGKQSPGKYTIKSGSELLIIEPEYVEWTGSQELYPFIFESIGDWGVTTSVSPPEGFIPDQPTLSTDVNTDVKALQFVVTDVGSKWVDTRVEHRLRHKGRTEVVKSRIGVLKKLKRKK